MIDIYDYAQATLAMLTVVLLIAAILFVLTRIS
jgi:hypothetical protein